MFPTLAKPRSSSPPISDRGVSDAPSPKLPAAASPHVLPRMNSDEISASSIDSTADASLCYRQAQELDAQIQRLYLGKYDALMKAAELGHHGAIDQLRSTLSVRNSHAAGRSSKAPYTDLFSHLSDQEAILQASAVHWFGVQAREPVALLSESARMSRTAKMKLLEEMAPSYPPAAILFAVGLHARGDEQEARDSINAVLQQEQLTPMRERVSSHLYESGLKFTEMKNTTDVALGLRMIEAAAERGNLQAADLLGTYFYWGKQLGDGRHITPDRGQVTRYFSMVAAHPNADSHLRSIAELRIARVKKAEAST